jgi:DNA-binding NarL/FixJ family response regulator
MYLLVTPKGQNWWRFDYRISGRRKTVGLGVYPVVSLKLARERTPDIAILDILMKGMSGVDVLRELKALDEDIEVGEDEVAV